MTKFRLYLMSFFFAASFGVVVFRAAKLQLFPHQNVENLAKRQLERKVEVVSRRGSIRDRNGRELAISINSLSLFANPRLIGEPSKVARVLSPVIGMNKSQLQQKIMRAKSRKFIWLARQLNRQQMKVLEAVDLKNLEGVGVLPEFRREFPQRSLASQVLGFVSVDGVGLEGIEKAYQNKLVGERESILLSKDALGRPVFTHRDQIRMELDQGADVELTIDSRLQYSMEKILHEAVNEHDAEGGSAIVMDPYSGEILAMGSVPNFDPNHPGAFSAGARRNRVITDPFEPGSVLKAFVVARALEDKLVGVNSRIRTFGGEIKIGRKTISEADEKHRFQSVSIVDLIRLSSNVGTVVLGQKLGWAKIEDTYRKLGFGAETGIDLVGESRGIFNSPRPQQRLEQATMSFGQGISLTLLQIAQSYSVLANGGWRVTPHVVKASQPAVALNREPERFERVFSQQTTEKMRSIMEKVVENEGTGVLAKVDGFKVAGKTATSQKVDFKLGGYKRGAYWSQFTGFIPSKHPKYVISVMIDEPKKNGYYGGTVAAPAFSKIAQAAIRLSQNKPSEDIFMSATKQEPASRISGKDAKAPFEGDKTTSSKRIPSKSKNAMKYSRNGGPQNSALIPDVVGMPLSDALRALNENGVLAEIENEGTIIDSQSVENSLHTESEPRIRLRLR